jgi:hypothetical protein
VRKWAAHHVLELIHDRPDAEQHALEIIEAVAALDCVESIGERIWLRNWRASKSSGPEFIDAVCRVPVDLRNSNQSPVSLLRGAGYERLGEAVRASDIADSLRRHPDLAEAWLAYSSDKRVDQGWYVTELPGGAYRVGYYPAGVVLDFSDRTEAVAEFVVRELRSIGDNTG